MNARRRKPAASSEVLRGEEALPDVESITLTLEDGRKATFNLADELAIPTDPDELRLEATRAPARYSFWSYQTERALSAVRKQEKRLAEAESLAHLLWVKYYKDHTAESYISNDTIRAHVAKESDVMSARIHLNSLRREYGMLRAVRDSQDHRTRMIHKLVLTSATPG